MGGKAEKGTPKYLANKMKAKGLQKLRWYCQMCQKQCRDENGFKCHTMSESHQRQLLLFADNSSTYIDEFSKEFADGYCELLKRQFGTKRVHANKVYQDYIADKEHIHMNATQWETLTEFVKWLGREGWCTVDETEKGWFVALVERDPAAIAAQQANAKKEKMDKDDEERMLEFIERQVERGRTGTDDRGGPVYTELKRENSAEKVVLSLKRKAEEKIREPVSIKLDKPLVKDREKDGVVKKVKAESKKLSALDEIMKAEEDMKERTKRKDYWLTEGIVVKVVTKSLGEKYYKQKATVEQVVDRYAAQVKMIDGGARLKLDQNHLETVIPAQGRLVKFVNGAYRGEKGALISLNADKFCCSVQVQSGLLSGRTVHSVQYEDISKLA